jgi:subtilisin family serine protease/ribosomal protein L32
MSNHEPVDLKGTPNPGIVQRLNTRRGIMVLAGASLLLVIAAIAGAIFYISQSKTNGEDLPPPVSLDELAQLYPQISNLLKDEKLDSVYKQFIVAYQEGGPEAAYEMAQKRGMLNSNNEVRMTLELDTTDTAALQASLEEHGIKVTAESGNQIDIAIPVEVLQASLASDSPGQVFMNISGLEHIVRIRLPISAVEDVGNVETEGAGVIGADAWNAAGITGKGVKIGVLDVGFDKYKDLLGTDLPANVVAQSFITGVEIDQTGSEHGSAVSEIIHDLAPDAELYFASYETPVEKQAAVDWLMSFDVDILTSSTGTNIGRRDGKGPLASMVDEVFAQGVLWVNSSGNTGTSHYRGVFTDSDGDGYHEFASGDEFMGFAPSGAAALSLNWNDWDNPTQDFDMYILDENGNEIASSRDAQNSPDSWAAEYVYYEFADEGPYYMAILAVNANQQVTFDFFLRDGQIEYITPEYSVNTPGDSNSALTVGAVYWQTGDLEDYSSRGPTEDGRIKPEIVAPSGVSSAAYGDTWDGTSASCPHVTGAAALVMQAFPDYTPQQVRDYLLGLAVDIDTSGPDSNSGYGALVLGAPPEVSNVPPVLEPTETAPEPLPTETQSGDATVTPRPTATPVLEKEPQTSEEDSGSAFITLLLLACVVLPGFLGLGGIGLLGAVFYMRRSRSRELAPELDRRDWGVPDQPAVSPPPRPRPVKEEPAVMVTCPNCGKQNRPGTVYCTSCGTRLAPEAPPKAAGSMFCNNCGNPLRPNAKFCPKCGQAVK